MLAFIKGFQSRSYEFVRRQMRDLIQNPELNSTQVSDDRCQQIQIML